MGRLDTRIRAPGNCLPFWIRRLRKCTIGCWLQELHTVEVRRGDMINICEAGNVHCIIETWDAARILNRGRKTCGRVGVKSTDQLHSSTVVHSSKSSANDGLVTI